MKTWITRLLILLGLPAIIAAVFGAQYAFGNVTATQPVPQQSLVSYNFFFATTTAPESGLLATTTSATSTNEIAWYDTAGHFDNGAMNIAGAKKVVFYFGRGDTTGVGNTGSSKFQVQVSPDGSNWYYWGKWQSNASSTVGFTAAAANQTDIVLTGTTTRPMTMDLTNDTYLVARCIVYKTTDGEASCKAQAQF